MSKRPGDPGYSGNWCIHYRSAMDHETCEAGVKYDSLQRPWPCFLEDGKDKLGCGSCEKIRRPTAEEMAAHEKWVDGRVNMIRTVMIGIEGWRKSNRGKSKVEVVECPVCKGRLHLSISAYNGHVHGKCETVGCVAWME